MSETSGQCFREVHCETLNPTEKSPCIGCEREHDDKNT